MSASDWNLVLELNKVIEQVDKGIDKSHLPQSVYIYQEIAEKYFDQEFYMGSLIDQNGKINFESFNFLRSKFERKTLRESRFIVGSIFKPINYYNAILLKTKVPINTPAGFIGKKLWPWDLRFRGVEMIVHRNQSLWFDSLKIVISLDGSQFLEIDASIVTSN